MKAARFTWLGHATVRVELPTGEILVIDPWLEGNPSSPVSASSFDRLDLILVTHAHGDHMGDVEKLAKHHKAPVICSYDLGEWFASRGVAKVMGMNLGGSQKIFGAKITQVRADHSSGFYHEGRSIYGGTASGFVVRLADGFCFYHSGDTALFRDMQMFGEIYQPRVAFLPIGDLFTMDPVQAARACRFLAVRHVIPIHWGTFPPLTGTPEKLVKELGDHGTNCKVIALKPGERY